MTIQERILKVIENKDITPYRFCKDLGLSLGYLDKRGAIGTDKYLKIIEYLYEINPMWLLTGKGSMLKEDISKPVNTPEDIGQIALLQQENAFLKEKITLLEENKTLQTKEIKHLEEEIKRIKSKI